MTDGTPEGWLGSIKESPHRGATQGVIAVLMQQPERCSYASANEIAGLAGVNVGSVTRAAQAIGFAGWPALRQELRARYLASLSMTEIADYHLRGATHSAVGQSLESDMRGVSLVMSRLDRNKFSECARRFAESRVRLAVGGGSYGNVAQLLAINATLAGYPTTAPPEGAALVNQIAHLEATDFVFAVSFWRPYESTIAAITSAGRLGSTVGVMTDHHPSVLTEVADFIVPVSAEGNAYFPSMTPAVATVNAFCTELAKLDPEHTQASVQRAEAEWNRAGLLRSPSKT